MQENALTPAVETAAVQLAKELKARNMNSEYAVGRALFVSFVTNNVNSFGIAPQPNTIQPMTMELAKARLDAFGESLLRAAEKLTQSGEAFDQFGYATEAVVEAFKEAGSDIDGYKIARVLNALNYGIQRTDIDDYNISSLRMLKRAKYLKRVGNDDPLRVHVDSNRSVYEYTDAVFDDHIPEFADVLFIGHQLRVVKDNTDNTYFIHKIGSKGRFVSIGWVNSLREAVIELPNFLKQTERRAVALAIEAAKRGNPIGCDNYTEREVRELAQAQGKEIPQETLFKVCHTGTAYQVVSVDDVSEETAVSVVSNALQFSKAKALAELLEAKDAAYRNLDNRINAVEELIKQLNDAKLKLQVAKDDADKAVANASEFKREVAQ